MHKDKINIKSDNYFNHSDDCDMYEEMGMDVRPVDVFGGLVPQGKSMSNLKECEDAIQERFDLEKPE